MIKKFKDLNETEKRIIHYGIFLILIFYIIYNSIIAYNIYKDRGWSHCLEERDRFTDEVSNICFNTSKELKEYIQYKNYPTKIDYKYINNYNYID